MRPYAFITHETEIFIHAGIIHKYHRSDIAQMGG